MSRLSNEAASRAATSAGFSGAVRSTRSAALALRLKDVNIDKIYSSPLKRAINTIKPTAIIKNQEINIVDDLREINVKTLQSFKLNEKQRDTLIECLQAGMKMHFDKEECDFISRYISITY